MLIVKILCFTHLYLKIKSALKMVRYSEVGLAWETCTNVDVFVAFLHHGVLVWCPEQVVGGRVKSVGGGRNGVNGDVYEG